MSTKYIASNWRLPNEENSGKSDNYGLTFDGVANEYIDCVLDGTGSSSSSFGSGSDLDLTISFWFKLSQLTTTFGMLSWATSPAAGGGLLFFVQQTNVGTVRIYIVANGAGYRYVSPTLSIDTWYNLTFTRTASDNTWRFYLNSTLDSTTYTDNGSVSGQSSATNFYIGSGFGGSGNFDGSISEVSIFNYALSESQISTLYGSSELGSTSPMALKPQPVGYWPLGDNSSGNPLTQPNEAVEDASVFDFIPNDYIDCGNISTLNGASTATFSAWFNTDVTSALILMGTDTQFYIQVWAANNRIDFITPAATQYRTTAPTINDGEWYHLTIVFNKDGGSHTERYKGYINGVYYANERTTSTSDALPTTSNSFELGKYGSVGIQFNGKMSNVAIWNSDQSSEISNIYNSGVPATSYTNTPTAWYKLDQSANWEADSSGAWQIPDAVSAYPQSFDFDGSSNYITVNNSSGQLNYDNITVSGWINPNATGTRGAIVSNTALGSGYHSYSFSHWLNNTMCLIISTSTNNQVFSTHTLNINEWNHVAFTWDGTTAKIYVNNQLTTPTVSSGNISNYSTNDVEIGKRTGASHYINGEMSNIQIFNTALPETGTDSVQTLYNNGVPLTTAIASNNLKAWYKLDNTATWTGSAYSVPDASGNGNTGTSSGMTEQNLVNNNVSALNGESSGMTSANLVLSDLTRAVPYDSYSFNFDAASSDYISLPTITEVNSATACTLSCWGKKTASDKYLLFGSLTTSTDGIWLSWWNNNKVYFAPKNVNSGYAFYTKSFDTNWHHFVGVYDGLSAKLYIDGNLVDTSTGDIPSSLSATVGTNFNIGNLNGPEYTDGQISNCSIFNQALTSTEVLKLYSNGVPQDLTNFTPAPVAWYPLGSNSFWNGSQWTVRDMSTGGSNDGTGQNIGIDGLVGDSPRSEANGTGTNMDIPTNLEGSTKWSSNNSWSINMSNTARVEDTP